MTRGSGLAGAVTLVVFGCAACVGRIEVPRRTIDYAVTQAAAEGGKGSTPDEAPGSAVAPAPPSLAATATPASPSTPAAAPAVAPVTAPETAGCHSDAECKGGRKCTEGKCVRKP